jgi:hypothetical protein
MAVLRRRRVELAHRLVSEFRSPVVKIGTPNRPPERQPDAKRRLLQIYYELVKYRNEW